MRNSRHSAQQPASSSRRLLLGRGSWPEVRRIGDILRAETVGLRTRNRVYRRVCAEEERDTDQDGIPDVYQRTSGP